MERIDLFTTIEITDFRGFRQLKLEGLQRVNLVVGLNNAGKTGLLEAVVLACDPNKWPALPGLLRSTSGNPGSRFLRWLVRDGATGEAEVCVASGGRRVVVKIGRDTHQGVAIADTKGWGACQVISVQMRKPEELVHVYARAARLQSGEEQIQALLHAVDGRVKKVRVDVGDDGSHLLVDLGLSEMIPLSQAGQGLNRLVAILSEIIGEKPQVCLLDEVENGLHYSVYEEVWTGIAEAATLMNVQVIATTHSRECLEAAHRAFSRRDPYDLSVVQLFRVEGGPQGRVLDKKLIAAALAGDIDLR